MHEFSLACNVLEIVEENVRKNKASSVSELTLEIGSIAGVELQAFQTAMESIRQGSILENAAFIYNLIPAEAECLSCHHKFSPVEPISPCPVCGNFKIHFFKGKELIVKTIVAE